MFTKCPSCRTEISFEPPKNAPAGYKHKIKCPNPACGAIISVAIPASQVSAPASQGMPAADPAAFNPQPGGPLVANEQTSGKPKYKGRARSCFMFILSLILFAVGIVAYLISNGTLSIEIESELGLAILFGLESFDGIGVFTALFAEGGFEALGASFSADAITAIVGLLPAIYFVLTGIMTLVNLIGFIGGKHGKTFNIIFSLLTLAVAVVIFLQLVLLKVATFAEVFTAEGIKLQIAQLIVAAVALIAFITSIIFCAKKKKIKEEKM